MGYIFHFPGCRLRSWQVRQTQATKSLWFSKDILALSDGNGYDHPLDGESAHPELESPLAAFGRGSLQPKWAPAGHCYSILEVPGCWFIQGGPSCLRPFTVAMLFLRDWKMSGGCVLKVSSLTAEPQTQHRGHAVDHCKGVCDRYYLTRIGRCLWRGSGKMSWEVVCLGRTVIVELPPCWLSPCFGLPGSQ